jgi:hypothetical protein
MPNGARSLAPPADRDRWDAIGGFGMHGLARCTCQGFIAGRNAAAENGKA